MIPSSHPIYLDYHATTPVDRRVADRIYQAMTSEFGNASSIDRESGTLNLPGIVGLGEACRLRLLEMEVDEKAIAKLRDGLQTLLLEQIPDLIINGDLTARLAGNLHISIPGIPNSAVIARVRSQLAISTGSACSSGVEAPSHVLQSLRLPAAAIAGALRIGVGKFTIDSEIDRAALITNRNERLVRGYRMAIVHLQATRTRERGANLDSRTYHQ